MKHYFQYIILFLTGAVILVVEIAGARLLAPFYGSTIFVWSSLITVTLGFLAVGYLLGGFVADKYPRAQWYYLTVAVGSLLALLLLKFSYPMLSFSMRFGFKWGALAAAFMIFALPLMILSMVSPWLIRLNSVDKKSSGYVSGLVFGISTFGSLAGALVAGFYLIPNFFLPNIFIYSLSVLVISAVLGMLIERSFWWMPVGAVFFLLIFLFIPFLGEKKDAISVVYHEPSFYGEIRVIEHNGRRCLDINNSAQTCVDINTGRQVSPYGAMINALIRDTYIPRKNLLVLGLGGGVLPRDLEKRFESVDTVEIDPKIADVAREFFGFDDSGEKTTNFIEDGRIFLKNTEKKYDVIILDAFSGPNPVPHLFTEETFADIKNVMSPEGLLIVNSIGRPFGDGDILPRSIFKTIDSVFSYTNIFSVQNMKKDRGVVTNIIFTATNEQKKTVIPEDYIVDYREMAGGAVIFRDFLNPIESLSAPFVNEVQKRYREFVESNM